MNKVKKVKVFTGKNKPSLAHSSTKANPYRVTSVLLHNFTLAGAFC